MLAYFQVNKFLQQKMTDKRLNKVLEEEIPDGAEKQRLVGLLENLKVLKTNNSSYINHISVMKKIDEFYRIYNKYVY
jgi:hypothetical protein